MAREVEVMADKGGAESSSTLMHSSVAGTSRTPRVRPRMFALPLSLGFAMLLSLVIGYGVAAGRLKVLGFVLIVATGTIAAMTGIGDRRRLFAGGAILSVATFSSAVMPYGITLSEFVFAGIIAAGVLRPLPECGLVFRKNIHSIDYLPVVALALVAGAAAVVHHEVTYWHVVYAMPLLVVLVAFQLVRCPAHVHRLLIAPVFATVGLGVIVLLAKYFGTAVAGGAGLAESYRLGFMALTLGPLNIVQASPLPLGVVLALCASPLIALSTGENERAWTRWTGRVLFPAFAVLVALTGSRGPILAFVFSASLTALLLLRTRRKPLMLGVLCLAVFAATFVAFPSGPATKFSERLARTWERVVGSEASASRNYSASFRVDILRESIGTLGEHPLGRGFGYLRGKGVDESIAYSVPVNGMGIAGVAVMGVILFSACARFLRGLLGAQDKGTREVAAVGMASLLVVLIAGLSTDAVLSGQVVATLVWFLGSICYAGLARVVPGHIEGEKRRE